MVTADRVRARLIMPLGPSIDTTCICTTHLSSMQLYFYSGADSRRWSHCDMVLQKKASGICARHRSKSTVAKICESYLHPKDLDLRYIC